MKNQSAQPCFLILTKSFAILTSLLLLPNARADVFLVDPQFSVSVTSNVTYGTSPNGSGVELQRQLDIYQPVGAGLPDKLPGVVLMHGGYYTGGSKLGMSDVATAFASRGYVAASINYRLLHELADAPGAIPPTDPNRYPAWLPSQLASWGVSLDQYLNTIAAATADEAMAVNWLADNADSYNIDRSRIAIGGFSAGAVSSLLLAYGDLDGIDADVAAVISFAGGTFGTESAINPNSPPAFIVHGTGDDVIPFAEYGYLKSALDANGVESDARIIAGGGHGTFFDSSTQSQMFRFLRPQLVPEPSSFSLLALTSAFVVVRRRRKDLRRWKTGKPYH